jgi:hypothetical protein
MFSKQIIAIALLGATTSFAHAQDQTEPATGKKCVTFMASELTPTGQIRMQFRNICGNPFHVQVQATNRVRGTDIEAGSVDKPAKAYVNCKTDERCEAAKWSYEPASAS